MWIVCITSVRHVLTVNGYGGRQTKENEKSWCFKGWETLVRNETTEWRKALRYFERIPRSLCAIDIVSPFEAESDISYPLFFLPHIVVANIPYQSVFPLFLDCFHCAKVMYISNIPL